MMMDDGPIIYGMVDEVEDDNDDDATMMRMMIRKPNSGYQRGPLCKSKLRTTILIRPLLTCLR